MYNLTHQSDLNLSETDVKSSTFYIKFTSSITLRQMTVALYPKGLCINNMAKFPKGQAVTL